MGKWTDAVPAEKYDGDTGKVSDVNVNWKPDKHGDISEILVSNHGMSHDKEHDHYYEKSNGWWGHHKTKRD